MGVEGDLLDIPDGLENKLDKAVSIIEDNEKFRIITHYDADGISASVVLARSLMKDQNGFHTTFVNSFPEDVPEGHTLIFTDIGNSHLDRISDLEEDAIVLDHHAIKETDKVVPEEKNKVFINPHDHGIDGAQEVSGGTLSLLLGVRHDEINWEESIYALAGAAADKQAVNGFSGLNRKIAEKAVEKDHVQKRESLLIDGENVYDSLMKACDPYFPGISGEKESKKILEDLHIDPESNLRSIGTEKMRKLTSLLALSLLKRDIPADVIESIWGTRYESSHYRLEVDILYKLLNSCARNDKAGLGFSLCLGDQKALAEAKDIREDYREKMIKKLKRLKEKTEKMDNIQYFYEEKKSRKGELAGLGMLYLLDQTKPVLGMVEDEEKVDISARANRSMIEKGLDLGKICDRLAGNYGGNGGGHDIAAGATVGKEKIDDFLERFDREVGEILKP